MLKGIIITEMKSSEKYFLGVSMLKLWFREASAGSQAWQCTCLHLELVLRTQKIHGYGVMKRS